jgi:protein gp37
MENSHIGWTNHTFNGWIGCTKVSEECLRCYAEAQDSFYHKTLDGWGRGKPRFLTSDKNWQLPLIWNADAEISGTRPRVFAFSMADVFDAEVAPSWRLRFFDLVAATPNLDWQVLTKRPELIETQLKEIGYWNCLPLKNVWLGFSAGLQKRFDERWPIIRDIPAVKRFCSYEPALGPLVLPQECGGRLSWLIAGGETSTRKGVARPMDLDWARTIRDQCAALHIPYFFKQTGNWLPGADGKVAWFGKSSRTYRERFEILDGQRWHALPSENLVK